MKNKSVPRRALASLAVAGIGLSLTAITGLRAATYSWDPSISGGTSLGGSGTWNTALANWWDGGSDVVWGNMTSDVGVFGGSAGAVTVSTAVNAGTLQFLTTGYTFTGSAITLGSGGIDASALSSGTTSIANAIALSAGQSWNIGTGASLLASGIVSGANSLTKTGAGTLTLSAVNTFSGGFTISQGTVSIAANTALGGTGGTTGAVTLDGGTLRTTNTAALTNTHAITIGASGGSLDIVGTAVAAQGSRVITGANTLLGSGTLTINGDGALDQPGGSGALVVTGANASYTGNIVLQNGGLLANEGGSFGSAATFTLSNNSELSTTNTLANAITVNGGTNSILSFTNGAAGVYSGPITLNGDLTIAMRNWYNQTAQNGTITGTISGSKTITVRSADANAGTGNTLTLGGYDAKASAAGIVLNGASLALNSNSGTAAASVTRAASLTINTGNLTVNGVASQDTNDVFGTLNLGGGSTTTSTGAVLQGYSTWTLTPNAATNTKLTFTDMGTRTAGSWVAIAGTVGLTPAANTRNIMFTNGLSGSNFIGAGGAIASGTASVIPWMRDQSGGTIFGYDAINGVAGITTVNVNPNLATSAQNINWNAASTLTGNRTVNSMQAAFSTVDMGGNTLTITSGVLTADNATFSNGTLNFGSAEAQLSIHNARTLNITGTIAGSAGLTSVGFRSSVDPSLILGGANTYTGVTNFYGYGGNTNVRLTNSLALQNTTLNHVAGRGYTMTFGNGGTSGTNAYTFGGLTGNANINLNNNNTVVDAVALTLGSAGSADTSSTVNTYSGVLSNTVAGGSIIKEGVAKQAFTAANTYSGGTTINAGTLLVNNTAGSGVGTGAVTVNGGNLGGTGFIVPTGANGITVNSGGFIAPGASIGTLTINLGSTTGNVQMMSSAGFKFELGAAGTLANPGTSDLLVLSGASAGDLVFNSNAVDFLGTGATGVYKLVDTSFDATTYTGLTFDSITGVVSSGLTATNLGSGLSGTFVVGTAGNGGNVGDIYVSVVPEPSAALLLGVGLVVVLTRVRRARVQC